MRRYLIVVFTLLGLMLVPASPVLAQAYQSSVGWTAGVVSTSSLNDGASGAGEALDMKPDLTWTAGGHYDRWLGTGHLGFRIQGGVARHSLPWTQGDRTVFMYTGDVSLMLRPAAPAPGRMILPFVSGGVGLSRWGLGNGDPTTFGAAAATYGGEETFNLLAPVALGLDFITPWRWGEGPMVIRIEGRDHIQFSSPFDPANPDQPNFGMIHNFGVVIGLHTGLGALGDGF